MKVFSLHPAVAWYFATLFITKRYLAFIRRMLKIQNAKFSTFWRFPPNAQNSWREPCYRLIGLAICVFYDVHASTIYVYMLRSQAPGSLKFVIFSHIQNFLIIRVKLQWWVCSFLLCLPKKFCWIFIGIKSLNAGWIDIAKSWISLTLSQL